MAIEVKERKVPGKLESNATALIAEAEQAGFSQLGWLSVRVFIPTTVAGFVDQTGTVVLAILGVRNIGAFQAVAVDLVTALASGETVTTSTNRPIRSQPDREILTYSASTEAGLRKLAEFVTGLSSGETTAMTPDRTIWPQPARGIFKYPAPANASVRKLVNEHAKNVKKHKSKAVARAVSIKDLAEFIEHYLKYEMEGLLVRHWLAPRPAADKAAPSKASGIEGGYVSTSSNTIRVGLEDGQYMWGGWDIHDSGTYKVMNQNEDACVISLHSSLGGARRIEVTREGRKYLFTPLPGRTYPEIFLRLDGAEFLSDSKTRPKIEKPELGEGKASGIFLPVEKTVEEFEKGFLQNVRKEVIPLLIRDGILTGKTVKKKVHVLDDSAFRRTMRFGIENFVRDRQGWSFVAFKAPLHSVAKTLRARKDVSSYQENVGASKLEEEACAPAGEGKRHVFLVRFPSSEWSILIQTIHWVEIADFVLGEELAKDLSKRLKCTAIAAGDSDVGGSGASVYKGGKKTDAFSTEEDWEQFYALFYKDAIFLPESFIAEVKKQPRLMVSDPTAVDRVDYMQIVLPETDE
jgi:hypothetical protein